jgi:hypothetical protein
MNPPFRNFGRAVCHDQLLEKLRLALLPHTLDGTECHRTINTELRGVENEIAASNIRHANVTQYRGCVSLGAAIEVIGKMIEDGIFQI